MSGSAAARSAARGACSCGEAAYNSAQGHGATGGTPYPAKYFTTSAGEHVESASHAPATANTWSPLPLCRTHCLTRDIKSSWVVDNTCAVLSSIINGVAPVVRNSRVSSRGTRDKASRSCHVVETDGKGRELDAAGPTEEVRPSYCDSVGTSIRYGALDG